MTGTFRSTINHRNQVLGLIQKECHTRHCQFVDPEFPPAIESLYKSRLPTKVNLENVVWKRASSFQDPPATFLGYVNAKGAAQQHNVNRYFTTGQFSNPCLPVAFALLCEHKNALDIVIPASKNVEWPRPDFSRPTVEDLMFHTGVFCFNLWHFGAWRTVVVDDYLPFYDSTPLGTVSSLPNEFWPPLLEKAFAKLLGNYEALENLSLSEIIIYFTGGLLEEKSLAPSDYTQVEDVDPRPLAAGDKVSIGPLLVQLELFNSLVGEASEGTYLLLKTKNAVDPSSGLMPDFYYVVSCLRMVNVSLEMILWIFHSNKAKVPMLRLSNALNRGAWIGPYSSGSQEWEHYDEETREKIGLTFVHEHQFWMTWRDVLEHFDTALLCRAMNTSVLSLRKTWCEALFYGRWIDRLTGGCLDYKESFLNNPQFVFDITPEEGDEVHIQLAQNAKWNVNTNFNVSGLYRIGLTLLKVEKNRQYRVHSLAASSLVACTGFSSRNNVFMRQRLRQGRYVIVPSTQEPGLETEFMLRLFTSRAAHAREMILDVPPIPACSWMLSYPVVATRITIYQAEHLRHPSGQAHEEQVNPYCIVECEGQKCTTSTAKGTLHPVWEETFLFFRKNPMKNPIVLRVQNRCRVIDDFLGLVSLDKVEGVEGEVVKLDLVGAGSEVEQAAVNRGHISVEFFSYKDSEFYTI